MFIGPLPTFRIVTPCFAGAHIIPCQSLCNHHCAHDSIEDGNIQRLSNSYHRFARYFFQQIQVDIRMAGNDKSAILSLILSDKVDHPWRRLDSVLVGFYELRCSGCWFALNLKFALCRAIGRVLDQTGHFRITVGIDDQYFYLFSLYDHRRYYCHQKSLKPICNLKSRENCD